MTGSGFAATGDSGPDIVLRISGPRTFRVVEPFRYQDPELGTITVPSGAGPFDTDLASVPWVSAWYIPCLGRHLPAAILHDALVCPPGSPTYRTRDGLTASAEQADRVFLDAMAALGTPRLRRWVMWSAVRLSSAAGPGRWRWYTWYLLAVVLAVALTIPLLGEPGLAPLARLDSFLGRPFYRAWPVAALVEFVVMAAIGPLLFGPRLLRATTIQAAVYGLTFLPTVLMIPSVLVFLGRRALGAQWPE